MFEWSKLFEESHECRETEGHKAIAVNDMKITQVDEEYTFLN
jgi:hypothetical protein